MKISKDKKRERENRGREKKSRAKMGCGSVYKRADCNEQSCISLPPLVH